VARGVTLARAGVATLARAGVATLALAVALTACPAEGPDPTPTADGTLPRPSPEGTVTVAYPSEPATLDPFHPDGDNPPTRDLARLLMPGFYRVDPDGERVLWLLAEEPTVTTEPRFEVRVTLRDDAVWSDGEPITVRDVRATWRLATDTDRPAWARAGYDQIRRIVPQGDRIARIVFRRAYPAWRDLFSAGLGLVPAHGAPSGRRWRVSGGPFVLQRWRAGLDMVFRPNPRAWDAAPSVSRLRVVFVPDASGALELFRLGRVDVLGPYHAPDWQRRVGDVAETVSSDLGDTWAGVLFNVGASPVSSVEVRRAFVQAIDRERLARGLVQSEGELLLSVGPRGPTIGTPRDAVVGARRRLGREGWTGEPIRTRSGAELRFTLAAAPEDLTFVVAEALKFQAARAGFIFETVPLDAERLWGSWLDGEEFEAAYLIWRDPPEGALRARAGRAGPGEWSAGRVERLVPIVPLYRVAVTLGSSARVGGVRSSATADGPLWNAHEWILN
jgi:peptide/nickel transport system substrate-binding protein